MPTAAELVSMRPFLDVLYYAFSGKGKSVRAARAPLPLIGLVEPQAVPHIAVANPDAMIELLPDADAFFAFMRSLKAGKEVELENGQPAYEVIFDNPSNDAPEQTYICQTVVLDSGSEVAERVLAWIMGVTHDEDFGWNVDNDLVEVDYPHWRKLQNTMSRAFHDLRSLPCHSVVLLLAEEAWEGKDENRIRYIQPVLYGKLKTGVGAFFTLVGRCERTADNKWITRWSPGNRSITKVHPNLRPITRSEMDVPGKTTVGSLALAVLGPLVKDPSKIPHVEGDDAKYAMRDADDRDDAESDAGDKPAPPRKVATRRPTAKKETAAKKATGATKKQPTRRRAAPKKKGDQ